MLWTYTYNIVDWVVIVNNFTNINSRQSPLTSTIEHEKKTTTYDVGNPGPGLEQAQKCGRIKPDQSSLDTV
jgi:hypothetical protein